jgi:hypothetical protein
MPVVSLTDRRAAGNRLVRFVFQRHLETVLYGRSEGSSGPIWKVMNAAGTRCASVMLESRYVYEISKSPLGALDFQGPAVTLKC